MHAGTCLNPCDKTSQGQINLRSSLDIKKNLVGCLDIFLHTVSDMFARCYQVIFGVASVVEVLVRQSRAYYYLQAPNYPS